MILPAKRNISIYKGADYELAFRVKDDDAYLDLTEYVIRFRASDQPGGTRIWDFESGGSPNYISVDAEGYGVIALPASVTGAVDYTDIYYEVDIIKDATVSRVLLGTAQLIESA